MNKKIRYSSFVGMILLLFQISGYTFAQSASDLAFNEILVVNDSLNVDDFGEHSAWIEIFNRGYNTVDIGGCYLTNDLQNPTKYWIPTGDPATKIPARCYILFWANNKPSRGIFHLNFDLKNSDVIALYNAGGKTLIDKLEIKRPQLSDISYGIKEEMNEQGETIEKWDYLEKITPASNNDHTRRVSSGEQFIKYDPRGIGMTLIAMAVVFSSLALLYIIFKTTGSLFVRGKNKSKAEGNEVEHNELSGEVSAAIAMTLHFYYTEIHDEEDAVLTIKKVARTYSPWSSKIYTLRKYPH